MNLKSFLTIAFVFIVVSIFAQNGDPKNSNDDLKSNVSTKKNQTDSKGLKQGKWEKKYENGKLAYEINFKDNLPVGHYKRYLENGKLYAHLIYEVDGKKAKAKLYDEEKGFLFAEGTYIDKKKHGYWKYYDIDGMTISTENYKNDKLNGAKESYYSNGTLLEKSKWIDGVETGMRRQYYNYPYIKLKNEVKVVNGNRNGSFYSYRLDLDTINDRGPIDIRGKYKDDVKHGKWIYHGKQNIEIEYIDGKSNTEDDIETRKLDLLKTNAIQNDWRKLRQRLENFGINPDKYITKPEFRDDPTPKTKP